MDAKLHRTYSDRSEQGDEVCNIHGCNQGTEKERSNPKGSKDDRRSHQVEGEDVGHLTRVKVQRQRDGGRSKPESTWLQRGDTQQ